MTDYFISSIQESILGNLTLLEEMSGNDTIDKLDADTLKEVRQNMVQYINIFQAELEEEVCSSEGHLVSDPNSTVSLVGCQDDDDGQDLTIVSTKLLFKSGVYRWPFFYVVFFSLLSEMFLALMLWITLCTTGLCETLLRSDTPIIIAANHDIVKDYLDMQTKKIP